MNITELKARLKTGDAGGWYILSGEEEYLKRYYRTQIKQLTDKKIFCNVEELICGGILCAIVALAFMTAVGRCINHPISWTVEMCQFLLSWLFMLCV